MNTKHTIYRPPPKTNTDNAINHPQINKSIKQIIKKKNRRQNRIENENTNRPVSPPNFRTARWWW